MLKIIEVFEKKYYLVLMVRKNIDTELPNSDKLIIQEYNNTTTLDYDSCRLEQLFF